MHSFRDWEVCVGGDWVGGCLGLKSHNAGRGYFIKKRERKKYGIAMVIIRCLSLVFISIRITIREAAFLPWVVSV